MKIIRASLAIAAISLALVPLGCDAGVSQEEFASFRAEVRAMNTKFLNEQEANAANATPKSAPPANAGERPDAIDIAKLRADIFDEMNNKLDARLAALKTAAPTPTSTSVDVAATGAAPAPAEVKAVLDSYMKENFEQMYEAKRLADQEAANARQREAFRTQALATIDRQLDRIAEATPMSAADREKVKNIYADLTTKSQELWANARNAEGNTDWAAMRTQGEELRKAAEETLKTSVTPEIYNAVLESGMGRMGGGGNFGVRGPGGAQPAPGGRETQPRNNNQPRRGGGDANPAPSEPSGEGSGEEAPRRRRGNNNAN